MEFQQFLSGWLSRTGWTLTQLADEVGVSQSLVSKWLHANPKRRVRPRPETVHRLAAVVGVAEVDLLRLLGYFSEGNAPDPGAQVDPDLAAVNAVWPRLEDGVRKAIRGFAEAGARGIAINYLPAVMARA